MVVHLFQLWSQDLSGEADQGETDSDQCYQLIAPSIIITTADHYLLLLYLFKIYFARFPNCVGVMDAFHALLGCSGGFGTLGFTDWMVHLLFQALFSLFTFLKFAIYAS